MTLTRSRTSWARAPPTGPCRTGTPLAFAREIAYSRRETLLQRYSLLLGRINALSTYLAQPAPAPPVRTGVPRAPPDPRPALERYIVHPLNPLPASADPIAPEAFFQVINTQSLPAVSDAQAELLARREWKGKEELRGLGEMDLGRIMSGLKSRLEREMKIAEGLRGALESASEEYEWGMRVDAAEGEEDGEKKDEEDDDLFGEEGEMEEVKAAQAAKQLAPNPREGWKIADYMRYMDTGVPPNVTT